MRGSKNPSPLELATLPQAGRWRKRKARGSVAGRRNSTNETDASGHPQRRTKHVMLKSIFPPFCLLTAIAMAVVAFAMLAFGGPEASLELHRARANGDELATSTLEADLADRQTKRTTMIVLLFVGSGVMTYVAFGSMNSPSHNRH